MAIALTTKRCNPPQHADAGLHRLARLLVGVYFPTVNGRVARRG